MQILHAKKPAGEIPVLELVLDGFVGRWFRRRVWAGTTIPLPFCAVVLYYLAPTPLVRVHEHHHVEQAQALGFFCWWATYLTAFFKNLHPLRHPTQALANTYAENPLEVDAYAVEADAQKYGLPDWAK